MFSVFTGLVLVTASNNDYSSASVHESCLNDGSFPTLWVRVREWDLLYDWWFTASLSWRQAPWESQTVFFFSTEHLQLKSFRNILSHERIGPSFTIAAGPHQRSHSQVRVPFYCLRFETLPNRRARSLYLYSPGTGWSIYTPRYWVLIFDPACTRAYVPSARTTVGNFVSNSTSVVARGLLPRELVCDRCLETALHATVCTNTLEYVSIVQ
jgi:hypothetical protein